MNNARSNIAFLCVKHHKDAHQLLDGKVGGGRRERVATMMRDRAITNAQYAVGQINAGRSVSEVAAEIGVHSTSVLRWFRKYREVIVA